MKHYLTATFVTLLALNITACGGSSGSNSTADCSKSALSNTTSTFGGVSLTTLANCSYEVPACNETGSWEILGNDRIKLIPKTTTCGTLDASTCTFAIVNDAIALACE